MMPEIGISRDEHAALTQHLSDGNVSIERYTGWDSNWKSRYTNTKKTLFLISRVLLLLTIYAELFPCYTAELL